MKNKLLFIIAVIISISMLLFPLSCKTKTPAQTENTDLSQIVGNIKSRIVQIALVTNRSYTSTGNVTIIGTGFLLNDDGYVITAAHYIPYYVVGHPPSGVNGPNPELVIVVPADGNPPVFPPPTNDCKVVAFDRGRDLVLLKISEVLPGTPPPPFIAFSNGTHEFINVGNAPLITDNVSPDTLVAITWYSGNKTVPETVLNLPNAPITGVFTGYSVNQTVSETITGHVISQGNYYTTDIVTDNKTNLGFSGSPVYSVKTGDIIGIL
ncbi:MAG: serine protease, partial [Dehalococcoidales bacterium]|nr:serine protease [Dehalococcoidales bacterium]